MKQSERLPHQPESTAVPDQNSGTLPFLLGNLLLGTIGLFVHYAGADVITMTWFRCAFGLLGLTIWLILRGKAKAVLLSSATFLPIMIASVLMVLAWGLFFFAIDATSTGVAVVLFHLQPLFVLLLGAVWLKEPVGRFRFVLVGIAMFGLVLATGVVDDILFGQTDRGFTRTYFFGIAACLVGALSTACVTLIANRQRELTAGVLAWWQCALGSVVLLAWPLQNGWPIWGPAWGWLASLGLIHTGLAYGLVYAGTARLAATRLAVLQFSYPALAIALDWLVLGQSLSLVQLVGIGVMTLAILLAEKAHP